MPIAALPTTTVSAIGSCQVLTDSCSLVKELVDNALDAHATSIAIEISSNVLAIIQVKDNGTGIAPNDFEMVCRRSCTSKITTLDDLRKLGGKSLGFRGQALASAAEMSGGLRLTTKTDKEVAAKAIEFGRSGDILSSENTSHPTGTTVRIKDFLKNVPVRRQTALKTTSKTIAKIKKTLQAYAIARPATRYSLKILRSPSDNGNWTYSPLPNAGMAEAALTTFGRDVAGQCIERSWPPADNSLIIDGNLSSPSTSQHDSVTYTFTALLPTPESDFQKIYAKGQFVSVDGRPVSTSRGTFKDLVKLYKSYIRHHSDTSKMSSDPFLCMNIRCSPGSYDPNVEPAKDDVLFVDSKKLLSVVEDLFKSVYGDLKEHIIQSSSQNAAPKAAPLQNNGFELLLARHPPQDNSIKEGYHLFRNVADDSAEGSEDACPSTATEPVVAKHSVTSATKYNDQESSVGEDDKNDILSVHIGRRGMYSTEDNEMLLGDGSSHIVEDGIEDDPAELRSAHINNPWTIAKMNATIRPSIQKSMNGPNKNTQLPTPAREQHRPFNLRLPNSTSQIQLQTAISNVSSPSSTQSLPLSPQVSPQETSGSPLRPWNTESRRTSNGDASKPSINILGGGGFATWSRKSSDSGASAGRLDSNDGSQISSQQSIMSTNEDLPRASREELSITQPFNYQGRKRQSLQTRSSLNSPFKSPMKAAEEHPQPTPTLIQRPIPSLTDSIPPASTNFIPSNNTDLNTVMDFERRKKAALEQRKLNIAQAQRRNPILSHTDLESASSFQSVRRFEGGSDDIETPNSTPRSKNTSSPHHNRYLAAKSALSSQRIDMEDSESSKRPEPKTQAPVLHPKDPRAYLIRQNAKLTDTPSQSRLKIQRAKTSLLPLETIPANVRTYDVSATIPAAIAKISHLTKTTAKSDSYVVANDRVSPSPLQSSLKDPVEGWKWESWDTNGLIQQCNIDVQSVESEGNVDIAKVLREHFLRHRG